LLVVCHHHCWWFAAITAGGLPPWMYNYPVGRLGEACLAPTAGAGEFRLMRPIPKILVIDDDADTLGLIRTVLTRNKYDATTASNWQEVVDRL
jgi:hypothetical protein